MAEQWWRYAQSAVRAQTSDHLVLGGQKELPEASTIRVILKKTSTNQWNNCVFC
jgi:hypothetical protein